MVRALLSLALVASASAFGGVMPAPTSSKLALSRVARTADVQMQAKGVVVGAACVGGLAGVYLTGEIQTGVIFAAILAYSTTTNSKFGGFAKGTGENAAKVWDKTTELNDQYDLLPKVRCANGSGLSTRGRFGHGRVVLSHQPPPPLPPRDPNPIPAQLSLAPMNLPKWASPGRLRPLTHDRPTSIVPSAACVGEDAD